MVNMFDRQYRREFIRAVGKAQKKLNKKQFSCNYPGCFSISIKSHSQQKEGQLRAISENGYVYSLNRNFYETMKKHKEDPLPQLKKIGIGEATTFEGFCSKHDQKLFNDIERKRLQKDNKLQILLLILRTISYEYIQKAKANFFFDSILNATKHFIDKSHRESIEYTRTGIAMYVEFEAPFYFNIVFEALENNDTSFFNYRWLNFPKNIYISTSCTFSPLFDRHHEWRLANMDKPQPFISFNIIPNSKDTDIVIAWFKIYDKYMTWIDDSINNKQKLEIFLNYCAFSESEDTCLRPSIWEVLDDTSKHKIRNAIRHYLFREPVSNLPLLLKI